jgi:succinate dehydrogenase/fumarate reductase-like Fe-S protein
MPNAIEIEVNGKRYPVRYDPQTPLLYVLRDELGLTGSKYGCGEGQCGSCTVLLGGSHAVPAKSPLAPLPENRLPLSKAWKKMAACIPSSKLSSTPARFSAPIARPA